LSDCGVCIGGCWLGISNVELILGYGVDTAHSKLNIWGCFIGISNSKIGTSGV